MELRKILTQTFPNTNIPEEIENLKMGDFPEWDSLGNFNLILAIEKQCNYQFDLVELETLNSVAAIRAALKSASID